jgi:RecB family endonuclease NucS
MSGGACEAAVEPSEKDSTVRRMRLLVARCEVLYTGRLTARLPEALRLLMFKADGSFLVHDDAGGYRPLNWIRSAFRLRRTRAHALVAS